MISTFGREALKAALYAKRKKLGRAARGKSKQHTRWLYPWATERRYGAAIKAWMRPMKEYVHEYLKNNQEAILRGDSASLMRQDAIPGGSYSRMVKSLNGWFSTYLPPLDDEGKRNSPPIVYGGLGKIAESMNDFNEAQWQKAAKAEIGVEFPVYENWWPDTKKSWQDANYDLIRSMGNDYIKRVNSQAERAVTNGWSPTQLAKEVQKIDSSITSSKAMFIARDQIGKLNGQVTQARMEAVGLDLYEWSTSGDERVRDSHAYLDGLICRWDDSTVYSEDNGKTWQKRPSDWCQLHPGQDFQCRCCALSVWDELVGEVDKQIDQEEGYEPMLSGRKEEANLQSLQSQTVSSGKLPHTKMYEDAEQRLKNSAGFDDVNFSGVYSSREVNKISSIISDTVKKHPELKGLFKELYVDPNMVSAIAAVIPNSGKLILGEAFTKGRDALLISSRRNVRLGNYPKGTKWYSAITHEMAHYIDKYITEKLGGKYEPKSNGNFSYSIAKEATDKFKLVADDVDKKLCAFAQENCNEFMAYGYMEFMDSENPRELAKFIGNSIIKKLKELKK